MSEAETVSWDIQGRSAVGGGNEYILVMNVGYRGSGRGDCTLPITVGLAIEG